MGFIRFFHFVYMIFSLGLHDSFIGFIGLLQSEDYMIKFTVFINHIDTYLKKSNLKKNNFFEK